MLHTSVAAAGPNAVVQNSFSEFSLVPDAHPVMGMVGGGVVITKDEGLRYCPKKYEFELESSEYSMWDTKDLSTNQSDFSNSRKNAGLIGADKDAVCERGMFLHIHNDEEGANLSTMKRTDEFESKDSFELIESIESPRADAEDRRRAWLEQRRYRTWVGARNLHIL